MTSWPWCVAAPPMWWRMDRAVNRKDIRLKAYDYSQCGAYFVTVCSRNREPLFWDDVPYAYPPVGADMIRPNSRGNQEIPLSAAGQIVDRAIRNIATIYDGVMVEKYVVMPDHVHMILTITGGRMISAPTISTIVGGMKRWASRQCGRPLWQKSFYDHVIRDDNGFLTRWNYIDTNPARRRADTVRDRPCKTTFSSRVPEKTT